jgi:hypothetical protein
MAEFYDDELIEKQMSFTSPDYCLYIPKSMEYDHNNVHLYVVEHTHCGELLAFWTQSTCESYGDNHVVMAKSRDGGKTWSAPAFIAGCKKSGEKGAQGSWGFPIVSRSGRIYLFYYRGIPGVKDVSAQITGAFSCMYSDDIGESWSESGDIPQRKTPYDLRADIQDNIVFELPLKLPDGTYLAGFTKFTSRYIEPELRGGVRVFFYHFLNIDDDPEIKDLKIEILPEGGGIQVYKPNGTIGNIEEPSLVMLPDKRIFCSMRTNLGSVFFSVSSDMGRSWTEPAPLAFSDNTFFTHPLSPCPVFDLGDGRFMQLYHGACDVNRPYHPRNVLRKAIGYFDPEGRQPIRFDRENDSLYMRLEPGEVMLGDDVQLAIYGSMTYMNGNRILWYPERKFFLLGKDVK